MKWKDLKISIKSILDSTQIDVYNKCLIIEGMLEIYRKRFFKGGKKIKNESDGDNIDN